MMSWQRLMKPLARQALPGARSLPGHDGRCARQVSDDQCTITRGPGGTDVRGRLVRRVGTNLNQAVARLNATGQRGEDLLPAAQFCVRVIRRLDEAAEHVRRNVP